MMLENSPRVGRLQHEVRRALIAAGKPLTTTELMRYCYPRVTQFNIWHYNRTREAARKFAVAVGHRRSRGAPILWELRK